MAQFLRDQQVRNLSIVADRIDELFSVFTQWSTTLANAGVNNVVSCVIRFDEKGYRVFNIADLMRLYRQAKDVERLVFSIETAESLRTNRQFGAFMELTLDRANPVTFLTVSSDDQSWVDGAFSAVREVLVKGRAWFGFVRTAWTELIVQITGVGLIFLLSLSAARKLAPHVAVENPFLIAFMFVFLLSGNIWAYLQRQIHSVIGRVFPNVEFVKEGRQYLHWLTQGCITTVVGVLVMYAITETTSVLLGTAGALVK